MQTFTSGSVQETEQIGEWIGKRLKQGDVLAYTGGMGMGKTAMTRGIAKGLSINPDDVSSPTFALVNEYHSNENILYHFDMYRIDGPDDLYSIGFYDYLDTESILVIEWSENIVEELPENTIWVRITPGPGENTRTITVQGDERY